VTFLPLNALTIDDDNVALAYLAAAPAAADLGAGERGVPSLTALEHAFCIYG